MPRPGRTVWVYQGNDLVAREHHTYAKTPERVVAFLSALVEAGGNVSRASKATGLPRMTVYYWREHDEEFAAAFEAAKKLAVEVLEDEALRRGFEGTDEPVIYKGAMTYEVEPLLDEGIPVLDEKGRVVMVPRRDEDGNRIPVTVKKYSDSMAQFMLRALDPEKYRDRSDVRVEDTGLAERLRAAQRRLKEHRDGGPGSDDA